MDDIKTSPVGDTAKERLICSAVKLFALQGYTATTTRQIAAEAGSSISMLNLHFGSKDNLYKKALERVLDVFAVQNIDLFREILEARQQDITDQEVLWSFIERMTRWLIAVIRDPEYRYEVLLLNRELQDWERGFQLVEPILLFFYNYALLFEAYTGAPADSGWAKELSFTIITGMLSSVSYPSLYAHIQSQITQEETGKPGAWAEDHYLPAIRQVLILHDRRSK